jgi:hypothetical protein
MKTPWFSGEPAMTHEARQLDPALGNDEEGHSPVAWMQYARNSHVLWRDHLAAHENSGIRCEQCSAPEWLKRTSAEEDIWVRRYDLIIALLSAAPVPSSETWPVCSICGNRHWNTCERTCPTCHKPVSECGCVPAERTCGQKLGDGDLCTRPQGHTEGHGYSYD